MLVQSRSAEPGTPASRDSQPARLCRPVLLFTLSRADARCGRSSTALRFWGLSLPNWGFPASAWSEYAKRGSESTRAPAEIIVPFRLAAFDCRPWLSEGPDIYHDRGPTCKAKITHQGSNLPDDVKVELGQH